MNFHRMNPLDDPRIAAEEARRDFFDETFPYWEQAVDPERFVSEADMMVPGTETVRTVWAVSDADFDAMCEALWVDPAERHF